MFKEIFNDLNSCLTTIPELKLIEWYLGQDEIKGGILNAPCLYVKFDPATITKTGKLDESFFIEFELLIYTDYMKGFSKVNTHALSHFDLINEIEQKLVNYDQIEATTIERKNTLLFSSLRYKLIGSRCKENNSLTKISSQNLTTEVHTTLSINT